MKLQIISLSINGSLVFGSVQVRGNNLSSCAYCSLLVKYYKSKNNVKLILENVKHSNIVLF